MATELKQETVDFAYAIDCTGSMSSYIQQTQKDIATIVEEMKRQFPAFKLRLACVGYRDWCDSTRLEYNNFTEDVQSFKSYIGNLKASGGGDEAEDVLGGLNQATQLGWNSNLRVLFHICDAPPHNKMYHDGAGDDYPDGHPKDPSNYHEVVLNKLKAKNIHLCIAKLKSSCDKMINVFQGYASRIGLTMEERSIKDTSQLLNAVKQTLEILTKMRKEFKQVENEITEFSTAIDALKYESDVIFNETMPKLDTMKNDVVKIDNKIKTVGNMVTETTREFDALKSTHSVVLTYVQNITDFDDVEKAEEKVIDLSEKLVGVQEKYTKASEKADKVLDDLTKKQMDLHKTEGTVTAKEKNRSHMKEQISGLTAKLGKMDKSANRDQLKKEIQNKLKEVNALFLTDIKMKAKIRNIKRSILKSFKDANDRKKHINECKRDVESQLNELDTVLDELDDRLC